MSQSIDPSRIFHVGEGFMASKTLLSAVELDLFTHLGSGAMTAAQIATALELHPRAVPDFPDCLVALEFLQRDGDGPEARYGNTAATAAFLDAASPAYVGGLLRMCNSRLYGFWGELTEGLRTGQPQSETRHTGRPLFDELSRDPDRLRQFVDAMTAVSRGGFQALAETFDFSHHRTVLDVGGADGQLSLILAGRHEHLRCTTFDLPELEPLAKEAIAAAGLGDRVQVVSGDFFSAALPEADVVTMSLILHDWNLEPEAAPDRRRVRGAPARWGARGRRTAHRRRTPHRHPRAAHVAQHARRVRRRFRVHRRGLPVLVHPGRVRTRRDPPPHPGVGNRGRRVQVDDLVALAHAAAAPPGGLR